MIGSSSSKKRSPHVDARILKRLKIILVAKGIMKNAVRIGRCDSLSVNHLAKAVDAQGKLSEGSSAIWEIIRLRNDPEIARQRQEKMEAERAEKDAAEKRCTDAVTEMINYIEHEFVQKIRADLERRRVNTALKTIFDLNGKLRILASQHREHLD